MSSETEHWFDVIKLSVYISNNNDRAFYLKAIRLCSQNVACSFEQCRSSGNVEPSLPKQMCFEERNVRLAVTRKEHFLRQQRRLWRLYGGHDSVGAARATRFDFVVPFRGGSTAGVNVELLWCAVVWEKIDTTNSSRWWAWKRQRSSFWAGYAAAKAPSS